MKKIISGFTLLCILAVALYSCKKEEMSYLSPGWQQTVVMNATNTGSRSFISEINLITSNRIWSRDSVEIKFDLDWPGLKENPVKSVDLYIYAQEKTATGATKYLGGATGKKIATVTNFALDGSFSQKLKVAELYALFAAEFTNTDRPYQLRADDIFEIKWVLNGADGSLLDSRKETKSLNASYGFGVSTIADIWSGTFDYVYTKVGSGIMCCTSLPKVKVGTTGSFTLAKNSAGAYIVPDAEFGASYNGVPVAETFTFDYNSGVLVFSNTKGHLVKWSFSGFNKNVVDISWTNQWTASYGESGTIRVTRRDAVNWPTNLK